MKVRRKNPLISKLILIVIFWVNCALGESVENNNFLYIQVANYHKSMVFSLDESKNKPSLVSSSSNNGVVNKKLAQISNSIAKKNDKRKHEAQLFVSRLGSDIKWASISPNKKFVLIGYQDPSVEPITAMVILKTSDLSVVMNVKAKSFIEDLKWSPDSNEVAILESTEHMKKNLWGLFAALSGHPIELRTYYVRWLNLTSDKIRRVAVTSDIENPAAELKISE